MVIQMRNPDPDSAESNSKPQRYSFPVTKFSVKITANNRENDFPTKHEAFQKQLFASRLTSREERSHYMRTKNSINRTMSCKRSGCPGYIMQSEIQRLADLFIGYFVKEGVKKNKIKGYSSNFGVEDVELPFAITLGPAHL